MAQTRYLILSIVEEDSTGETLKALGYGLGNSAATALRQFLGAPGNEDLATTGGDFKLVPEGNVSSISAKLEHKPQLRLT